MSSVVLPLTMHLSNFWWSLFSVDYSEARRLASYDSHFARNPLRQSLPHILYPAFISRLQLTAFNTD